MRRLILLTPAAALALAACEKNEMRTGTPMAGGQTAAASLATVSGQPAGNVTVAEVAGGLRVNLEVRGMPAGQHGVHLHTVGRCDPPDFTTAGGHWNPASTKHGSMNPQGPHAGDLPNLTVGSDGRGTLAATLAGATMAGVLDADGTAMIVHAGPDDLMTDPAGNSGGRVACGVLRAT